MLQLARGRQLKVISARSWAQNRVHEVNTPDQSQHPASSFTLRGPFGNARVLLRLKIDQRTRTAGP